MEEAFYENVNHIQIDSELYQLEKVEFEDETFFFMRRSDEILCMIMRDENNQLSPDCEIPGYTFNQILSWINKLYFNY
jgi:hypothetical protein